ncbi:Dihydroxyacetone synthase, partial [Ceratobasidium sp. 428]
DASPLPAPTASPARLTHSVEEEVRRARRAPAVLPPLPARHTARVRLDSTSSVVLPRAASVPPAPLDNIAPLEPRCVLRVRLIPIPPPDQEVASLAYRVPPLPEYDQSYFSLHDTQLAFQGSSQCTPFSCPAGKYVVKNWCTDCPSGTYSAAGATSCSNCPAGTVSLPGSSACFACPAGFISHPAGIVCLQCPANTYTSGNQCVSCPGNPAGSSSCGPQPSKRAVQPVLDTCSSIPGHRRCAVLSGGGGSECINTHTTLESCGGCVGMLDEDDDSFTGKDCSMIPNVNAVKCERGQCKVMSCRNGYEPVDGGCVATSHSKAKRGVLMHARHDSF